jgi:ribonuclease D
MADNLVVSVDCEGLFKGKPISLLQLSIEGFSYILDLTKFSLIMASSFVQVLASNEIIKVCHDFCEDAAGLYSNYGIICDGLFDTQVAHRLLNNKVDY